MGIEEDLEDERQRQRHAERMKRARTLPVLANMDEKKSDERPNPWDDPPSYD